MPRDSVKTGSKHKQAIGKTAQNTQKTPAPGPQDIWHVLENLPEDDNFRINIEREKPELWDEIDISGLVAQYFSPVNFETVRKKVGGGSYKITVWKGGDYYTAQRVRIPGPPRVEDETIKAGRSSYQADPGQVPVPGRVMTPAVVPPDQNSRLYEMFLELKHEVKNRVNQNGNGSSKNPLESLTSLASLISTLSGALNQNNDPKKNIDMISNAFTQGMDVAGKAGGSGPSGEVMIAAEVIKGLPQVLETWVSVEKMKMQMWLENRKQAGQSSIPAAKPSEPTAQTKNQDPVKLALVKIRQAAEVGDDPNFWAAYLVRFIDLKIVKSLVEGGEKQAIKYFTKIEPGFMTVIQKHFDWFGELFKELKELTAEDANNEPEKTNDNPGGNPKG